MKIVLIHCYSDNNKGDLGIILATIQLLRRVAPTAEIMAISTFERDDPFFDSEHQILKQHVDCLYPAVVGRAYSKRGTLGLTAKTLLDVPKLVAMYFPKWFPLRSMLLGKHGTEVANLLQSADLVISKGGSFLCSNSGAISNIRLMRLMSTLRLSLHENRNVVIWGQSIGPVSGSIARALLNACLARTRMVILREDHCKTAYPYLRLTTESTTIGWDLAFSLKLPAIDPTEIPDSKNGYVGFTIKPYTDTAVDENYSAMVVNAISTCVEKHRKHVIIIPHVTIDRDQEKSEQIYRQLDGDTAKHVTLLGGIYDVKELLGIYGCLDLLIGTRLHSTIFAMSVNTPAINISYHGTKSRGVYSRMGLEDLVVEAHEFSSNRLSSLIDEALRTPTLKARIEESVAQIRETNFELAAEILHRAAYDQASKMPGEEPEYSPMN